MRRRPTPPPTTRTHMEQATNVHGRHTLTGRLGPLTSKTMLTQCTRLRDLTQQAHRLERARRPSEQTTLLLPVVPERSRRGNGTRRSTASLHWTKIAWPDCAEDEPAVGWRFARRCGMPCGLGRDSGHSLPRRRQHEPSPLVRWLSSSAHFLKTETKRRVVFFEIAGVRVRINRSCCDRYQGSGDMCSTICDSELGHWGLKRVRVLSDDVPAIFALVKAVRLARQEATVLHRGHTCGTKKKGAVENTNKTFEGFFRTTRASVESRYGHRLPIDITESWDGWWSILFKGPPWHS